MSDTDFSEPLRPLIAKAQDEVVANLDATGRGVRSGLMRSELSNRANLVVDRYSAGLAIPESIRERFEAFNEGTTKQPARPITEISPQLRAEASQQLAKSARDQLVSRIKSKRSPTP